MKTIVLNARHPDPTRLLADGGPGTVRALAEAGASGRLADGSWPDATSTGGAATASGGIAEAASLPGLTSLLGAGPGEAIVIGERPRGIDPDPVALGRARFSDLRRLAGSRPWSFAQIALPGPASGEPGEAAWEAMLDDELGLLLAGIEGEVTILLVATPDRDRGPDDGPGVPGGVFVLASTRAEPIGVLDGVRAADLPPTLLLLAGLPIPETMPGTPIALRAPGAIVDDDEAVMDRLRGLGYIDEWG